MSCRPRTAAGQTDRIARPAVLTEWTRCVLNPSHFHRDSDDGLDVDRGDHLHGGDGAAVGGAAPAPFLLRGVPHAGKTPVPKPGECYPGLRRRLFWRNSWGADR